MNENDQDIMVKVPSSIFGRPRARESRRNRQIQEMLSQKENTTNHLFSFKVYPTKDPDASETRPLPKCCKICLPDAEMVIQEEMKFLGLRDCFLPPTRSTYNSLFVRNFPFYSHYKRCINVSEMHNLPSWQELETDTNLLKPFHEGAANNASTVETDEANKQEVLKILCQLQVANVWKFVRKFFIRISLWICQKYLSLHFESVLVHGGQIELLKDVHSKKLPVIFIPVYRSKFDKILIMWTLAHNGFRTPLFFRDHHQKYQYIKYFGGIGASLQVHSDQNSEMKYCSAVAVYMQHVLRKGNSLMLNLESGRSRCGRPSPNVYGTELLKVIFDEYKSNKIEDAYFVPVSVSYELFPDAKEVFEGWKPTPHSMISWVVTLVRGILFPKPVKGIVKVDFAQPTCFRELHNSLQSNVKVRRLDIGCTDSYTLSRNCANLRWSSCESLNSISSIYGELAPLYPTGNNDKIKEANLLDVVNHHLVYDAGRCESVMPTHLLSFILMKKYRSGIFLEQLKDELQWLIKIVQDNRKDFGFFIRDCDMESIAFRAVELLKDDIVCQSFKENNTFKFVARQGIVSQLRLEYYANYLLPLFMMEGVIATAIFAMRGTELCILKGLDMEIKIKDEEFMHHCRRVYNVLTGGFLLHPPCLSAESAIRKQIYLMNDKGVLTLVMRDTKKYCWEDNISDLDYDEYEEPFDATDRPREIVDQEFIFVPEEIKLTTCDSTFTHLSFYRGLLMPYFEVFAFLITSLKILLDHEKKMMNLTDLEKHLVLKLREMSEKDLSHCPELCNRTTVKQFIFTCEDNGIVRCDVEHDTMNIVCELLKSKEDLQTQADDILFYITV